MPSGFCLFRGRLWALWAACLAAWLAASAPAARAEQPAPRKWALLIGIEKYEKANPLRYTVNDCRQLARALAGRGDFRAEEIVEIVDSAEDALRRPLRASLLAEIPKFLARPGPEDLVLVYFSGHGFRDREGKLYLAPMDCDPADAAATGVPVEWFRGHLAACKARTKLLVLDACHAGSEKGEDGPASVSAKDLGAPFRDLEGVVTLASSTSEEKSQVWEEKQQSLFTYWLTQALKGHADRDGDAAVTIDELYDYVFRGVTHSAKSRFGRAQTPVRIVRTGTPGVPVVVRLAPQRLKQVLADVAEQLAWAAEERSLTKVGVLEFTNDTKLGELLGADFGLLGRWCAAELERQLVGMGGGKFAVVDNRRLQAALKAQGFGIQDLGSPDALADLSRRAGGMRAIALGTLQNRAGRVVTLQCKLVRTDGDELAGSAGGTALLSESEWAMLGRSIAVEPDDRRPPMPGETPPAAGPGPSLVDLLIDRIDHRARGPHPMADPRFPLRVKIMVPDAASGEPVERRGVFRGNDLLVPLRKGETYEVRIENNTGEIVLMRLLVDGLNTLPDRAGKGMAVEPAQPSAGLAPAVRVSLDEARHWVLDPRDSRVHGVRGFFTSTGPEAQLLEFKVVDAQDSVAARQQFTDQIGLITAAFYEPKGGPRRVGTGFGNLRTEDATEAAHLEVGNLRAVVHIHYVEPEALQPGG